MKKVWISALAENQPRVSAVSAHLKKYGLACQGHFWADAPEKMAWRAALTALLEQRADVWLILADEAEMAKPGVRYGLSLMAAALRQARGNSFPIVMLWNSPAPALDALPTLLRQVLLTEEASPAWTAKIVAKANVAAKPVATDYRLNVQGDDRLGQWFEIGPVEGSWSGVVFGVQGGNAEIQFQAVGAKAVLPEKTTLEFAQQGLKVEVGGREYVAWAVRNDIDANTSYFVKVKGCPESILFMPYADETDAEAHVLRLV